MSTSHRIVTRSQWLEARQQLLAAEKDLTRLRDQLSQRRRELPWVKVEQPYRFDSAQGPLTLAELFGDKRQLLVYHLMFAPDWEVACKSCSFWADGWTGILSHLAARDVSFAAISRAPLPKLQAYAKRLGWTFRWVSSGGSDFNFDFGVSFDPATIERGEASYNYQKTGKLQTDMPGVSVFYKGDDGAIYHTYSTFARGIDALNPAYQYLDLTPKGRDEAGLPHTMSWVKRHDEY